MCAKQNVRDTIVVIIVIIKGEGERRSPDPTMSLCGVDKGKRGNQDYSGI